VIAFDIPWWAWAILAIICLPSSLFAGFTAMATVSATGSNYHSLSKRQVKMGKTAYYVSLLTAFVTAAVGVFALIKAVVDLIKWLGW
jgi:hypothetical protein